jgi:hypothetical protein
VIASHTAAASRFDNHPTNPEQLEQVKHAICGPLPGTNDQYGLAAAATLLAEAHFDAD